MSWSNINIKQLSEFISVIGDTPADDLLSNLKFRAKVVSIFRNEPYNRVLKSDVDDVIRISDFYLDFLLTYKVEDPKGEVTIDGVTYRFNKDRNKWRVGQVIDAKMLTVEQIKETPERLVAIFYLEKDYDGDNSGRASIFAEKFPPIEYWNFINFFLANYEQRKLAILSLMTARAIVATRKINKKSTVQTIGLFGRQCWLGCRKFGAYLWTRLRHNHT